MATDIQIDTVHSLEADGWERVRHNKPPTVFPADTPILMKHIGGNPDFPTHNHLMVNQDGSFYAATKLNVLNW